MSENNSYKQLRAKLDEVLEELDQAEASDIDETIKLHNEALSLIDKLEAELDRAVRAAKAKIK